LLRDLALQPLPLTHERAFWMEVLDWLAKDADHEPDWADACLAVLSGRDRKLKIWTYDREFQTTWRRPDGTAIPLAVGST
jgi:predicted nucleic acid-binding protein